MEWLLGIIATLSVPVTGGVFAWITQKASNKSQRETALIEQSGPDWKAFTDEMKDWTNKQLEERDAALKELRAEVASLAQKLEVWKSRYYIAVHHIRQWRLKHPESVKELPVPDELENDF